MGWRRHERARRLQLGPAVELSSPGPGHDLQPILVSWSPSDSGLLTWLAPYFAAVQAARATARRPVFGSRLRRPREAADLQPRAHRQPRSHLCCVPPALGKPATPDRGLENRGLRCRAGHLTPSGTTRNTDHRSCRDQKSRSHSENHLSRARAEGRSACPSSRDRTRALVSWLGRLWPTLVVAVDRQVVAISLDARRLARTMVGTERRPVLKLAMFIYPTNHAKAAVPPAKCGCNLRVRGRAWVSAASTGLGLIGRRPRRSTSATCSKRLGVRGCTGRLGVPSQVRMSPSSAADREFAVPPSPSF